MAKGYCLLPELADKLKQAALKNEINIEKMYSMTSQERRSLFEKYIDKDNAQLVNTEFERAMVSEQQNALLDWAQRTFSGKEKKSAKYKDVIAKIDDLNKLGVLTPENEKAYLEDLVRDKLGVTVTNEEAAIIAEKATELEALGAKVTNLGDPFVDQEAQLTYLRAKRKMEDYLDSLTPQSKTRIALSTISRGNMLFRIASIAVNVNSNNLQGSLELIVRRFNTRSFSGMNNKSVVDTVKFFTKVYKQTGYDLSRMTTLDSDRKILGEEYNNAQGPGVIRKAGRIYQDLIFEKTQGLPDVFAASFALGDRANLMSTRLALAMGLKGDAAKAKAQEFYKDSLLVEPKTKEGDLIRKNGIADALRSTNQDDRLFSERALKFRSIFNVGDLRFGDVNIPFVKTTANAIQSGLEVSGVTVPSEVLVRTIKMVKFVKDGNGTWGEASKEAFTGFSNAVIRAGIGMTAAFLLANAIDPRDYMGAYPTQPKERELLRLRKATANSINIGGRWVSLDWFGPLATPLVGFLSAKKYGKTFEDTVLNYFSGSAYQVTRIPGLDWFGQTYDYVKRTLAASGKQTTDARVKDFANFMAQFVTSRAIPGIIQESAKATDPIERETKSKTDALAPLKAAIPGIRQTLPEKIGIFGETTPGEGWKVLLFGGRLKTGRTDAVIEEMVRLQEKGNLPAIAPLDDPQAGSDRMVRLKTQIGEDKYRQAIVSFGKKFHSEIAQLIKDSSYKELPDEDKKVEIDKLKGNILDDVLEEYGYEKPEK